MMPLNKEYQGWGNYPTWRVALEFFDGYLYDINQDGQTESQARSMVEHDKLQEMVEDLLEKESTGPTVLSYAMAFLEDVDWREIEANLVQEVYEYDWSE